MPLQITGEPDSGYYRDGNCVGFRRSILGCDDDGDRVRSYI
jgi:hypothetical protein